MTLTVILLPSSGFHKMQKGACFSRIVVNTMTISNLLPTKLCLTMPCMLLRRCGDAFGLASETERRRPIRNERRQPRHTMATVFCFWSCVAAQAPVRSVKCLPLFFSSCLTTCCPCSASRLRPQPRQSKHQFRIPSLAVCVFPRGHNGNPSRHFDDKGIPIIAQRGCTPILPPRNLP